MTKEPSDAQLARLLSGRDEPSVLDLEAGFERVAAEVAPPRRRRWALWSAPLAAALGAAAVLVAAPGAEDEFAPRGVGAGNLQLACLRAEAPAPCAAGATLTLDVTPPPARAHFAAFARRPDGRLMWFLPAAGETSAPRRGLLDAGFVLAGPPGPYTVYGVFSDAPMTRAAIAAAFGDDLAAPATLTVVERALEVGSPP